MAHNNKKDNVPNEFPNELSSLKTLYIIPDYQQLQFSGNVREKSQVTIDNAIMNAYDIEQGDTIFCKVVGIKKNNNGVKD
jgi:hypothetical protein